MFGVSKDPNGLWKVSIPTCFIGSEMGFFGGVFRWGFLIFPKNSSLLLVPSISRWLSLIPSPLLGTPLPPLGRLYLCWRSSTHTMLCQAPHCRQDHGRRGGALLRQSEVRFQGGHRCMFGCLDTHGMVYLPRFWQELVVNVGRHTIPWVFGDVMFFFCCFMGQSYIPVVPHEAVPEVSKR